MYFQQTVIESGPPEAYNQYKNVVYHPEVSMTDLLKVPRTKKGVDTLNSILSAATQLIYERGYYGANIADITQLAGVAAGTSVSYTHLATTPSACPTACSKRLR